MVDGWDKHGVWVVDQDKALQQTQKEELQKVVSSWKNMVSFGAEFPQYSRGQILNRDKARKASSLGLVHSSNTPALSAHACQDRPRKDRPRPARPRPFPAFQFTFDPSKIRLRPAFSWRPRPLPHAPVKAYESRIGPAPLPRPRPDSAPDRPSLPLFLLFALPRLLLLPLKSRPSGTGVFDFGPAHPSGPAPYGFKRCAGRTWRRARAVGCAGTPSHLPLAQEWVRWSQPAAWFC